MSIFEDIKKHNADYSPNNSVKWFRQNVTNAFASMGTQQFLGKNLSKQVKTITPKEIGKMVFFGYDPKGKDKLPYYDKFPMILPFYVDRTHFMGINLHYLDPRKRLTILDGLLKFSTDGKIDDNMKVKLSWQLLQKVADHRAAANSVKKYIFAEHVKTNFVIVDPSDWPIAVFLPLCRMVKKSEQAVWADS